jgi:flagellin-specific chaperone FliS
MILFDGTRKALIALRDKTQGTIELQSERIAEFQKSIEEGERIISDVNKVLNLDAEEILQPTVPELDSDEERDESTGDLDK